MQFLVVFAIACFLVAYWLWRTSASRVVVRRGSERDVDALAALRRVGYRHASGRHPVDGVDDPRLAAAAMMAAIAQLDGALSQAQMNALRVECRAAFRVDQRQADDIAVAGRWLSEQSADHDDAMRRLATIVRERAGAEAHGDLLRMLERVASVASGAPSEKQAEAIALVRRSLTAADA